MAFSRRVLNLLKSSSLPVSRLRRSNCFSSSAAERPRRESFAKLASLLESGPNADPLKKLLACVVTRGLEGNAYLGAKFISSLARFNALGESGSILDRIVADVSVWSSIMIECFRASRWDEALGLYLYLRRRDVGVDVLALVFGLKSCVELGNFEFGRNLHSDGFKFGLSCDQFVCSSLIGCYSKFGQIGDAGKVFDEMPERDVVAYTALITAYARVDDPFRADGAFRVAIKMQCDGFEPNRVTLVSLLQCASPKRGKAIHCYALRKEIGIEDEVFKTSLMDLYTRSSDLKIASVIFDRMEKKTTASWNTMMAGYLKTGQPFEALNLFRRMVQEGPSIDMISLANVLLSCTELGQFCLGKAVHCHMVRQGVHLDVVGATALINMYCKCGELSEAMSVFRAMDGKDGVLFGVMIAGFLSNGFAAKAVEMFHEVIDCGIKPSTSAIIHLLSALSELKDTLAVKSVHGFVFRRGLEMNKDIANQFITAYTNCGLLQPANSVFDGIKHKDRVSWTSLMTGLVNHSLAQEAIASFRLMRSEHVRPDAVTFTCLIQVANQLGSVLLAQEVHAHIYRTTCLEGEVESINSLITAYSKWGKLKTASNLFEQMTPRDISSWNTMISAHGMNGDCIKALELFNQMRSANVYPDSVTFKSVLSACSHAGLVQQGFDVFASMVEDYKMSPSDEHYGCMVDMLGRAGQLEEAYKLLECMPWIQSASSLGALLGACRVHGDVEMGERVGKRLLEMQPWSGSAYRSMSNLYADGGRWDAVDTLGAMAKEKGLRSQTGYTSLVDVTRLGQE